MYTDGPYSDMPRGITYIGQADDDLLIDHAEDEALSGWFRKLRKTRPAKWKPKQFLTAAAVIGGAVLLGPAAAIAAARAARMGSGLIRQGARFAMRSTTKSTGPQLQNDLSRFSGPVPPFTQQDTESLRAPSMNDPGQGSSGASSSSMLPLLAIAGLVLMSKKGK